MNELLNTIELVNADHIRGNMTLPETVDGKAIAWKSSRPEIISDTDCGLLKKGVVKRGTQDETVTLTATVTDGAEVFTKEFTVMVVKAPKPIPEEAYEGYLFGHFIGEETPMSEQIYFALSTEGMRFCDLNGKQPVLVCDKGEKGVRDPFLYRSAEGDRFFLVATDLSIHHRGGWFKNEQGYYDASTTGSSYLVVWESDDLVHWSEARLCKVAPENAGMAWAPEMIYHEETGEYIIFFASSIMDPLTKYKAKPNTIFYVATRDFVQFSEPAILIDNRCDGTESQKAREIIDTTILKVGEYYYSISKDGDNDEPGGGIVILKTKTLLNKDSWEKVGTMGELTMDLEGLRIDRLDNSTLEGPELFVINKKDRRDEAEPEYGIIADRYAIGAGYTPFLTTDLEDMTGKSWRALKETEYSFDKLKKRHGTVLRITLEEANRLKEYYKA